MLKILVLFTSLFSMVSFAENHKEYYKDTETIPYKVIETINDDVEIRQYPSLLAVATNEGGTNGAFRLLFNYITGDNNSKADIAMTAPVEMPKQSESIAMTSPVEISSEAGMMFFLPNQYTKETAPLPSHPKVFLKEMPSRKVAAIQYSGFRSDAKQKKYTQTLLSLLNENGKEVIGEASYLGYDSPFTLPWNRRNEIIIPIR